NAIKHGLSAKTVLLEGESPAEFNDFRQGFRRDFQPVGTVENVLVDELASLKWRSRRLLIAEKAEIELQETFNSRTAERERQDLEEASLLDTLETSPMVGLIHRAGNPLILDRCLGMLRTVQMSVLVRG